MGVFIFVVTNGYTNVISPLLAPPTFLYVCPPL